MSDDTELILSELHRLERKLERHLEKQEGQATVMFQRLTSEEEPRDLLRKPKISIGGAPLWELARRESDDRLRRESHLPAEVCEGRAWNILLYLLISQLEQRPVAVGDAMSASLGPQTTALRHITILVQLGLCRRDSDQGDKRRTWLALTEKGYLGIARYYEEKLQALRRPLKAPMRN